MFRRILGSLVIPVKSITMINQVDKEYLLMLLILLQYPRHQPILILPTFVIRQPIS
uniref:Uncharacterized protein n=1 Tax=Candidatus Methanogaster sp. ANME-2c ERB4 TaxID=2759911 RepID=A0A7G9Y8R4_9EURY|nr:hypothetical protein PKGOHPGF_00002 [Methanosarcinales archaeon ANME-2c ERB4]